MNEVLAINNELTHIGLHNMTVSGIVDVGAHSHLRGGLAMLANGDIVQYGGCNAAGVWNGYYNRMGNAAVANSSTPGSTVSIKGPAPIAMPGSKVINGLVYTSGYVAGKAIMEIFDPATNTVTDTVVSTHNSPGNESGQFNLTSAIEYEESTGLAYVRHGYSDEIRVFHVATKKWLTAIKMNNPMISLLEGFALIGGSFYFYSGWDGAKGYQRRDVCRYKKGDYSATHWMMLNDSHTCVNQGWGVINGKIVILRFNFTTSRLELVSVDPVKRTVSRLSGTIVAGYRNAPAFAVVGNRFLFGGGTNVAVGAANWVTAGRQNKMYSAQVTL